MRDPGEGVLANQFVEVWPSNLLIKAVRTGADGTFRVYGSMVPGTYILRAPSDDRSGWVQTSPANQAGWPVTITGMETVTGVEIGLRQATGATIYGSAWYDADADGAYETSDQGVLVREAYIDADGDAVQDPEERWQQVLFMQGYRFTNLPAGTYTVRIVEKPGWAATTPTAHTVTVAAGETALAGNFGQIQTDFVRPRVVSSGYFVDARGPGVRFAFDEDVEVGPNGRTPLVVRNLTTGQDVAFAATYDPATRVAVFRPVGSPVLAGGNYRAILDRVYTTDLAGNALADSAVEEFAVAPGDADGDGAVGFADLVLLAQNYGATNPAEWRADLNFDGVVDFDDLVILAQNYGAPGPVAVSTPRPPLEQAAARDVVDARAPSPVFATTPVARAATTRRAATATRG